jgi:hypothetical protein
MSDEARCPVCGRPAGTWASCTECGWPLNTRLRAGAVTLAMRQEFETKLRLARKVQAERDERALKAALGDVIAAARPDGAGAVIEVSPDRIEMVTAHLDDMESPQVRDGWRMDWTTLLPTLPGGERDRHAQLVGGVAGLSDDRVAALMRDRLPPVRGAGTLVVCRPAGGQVLETAADAIARAARPPARLLRVAGTSDIPVRSLLTEAAATAPLRRPYYLLTAAVNAATGEVRLRPRQLFAAGDTPGTGAMLALRRMPGDMADTTLAIFAGNGRTDWSGTRPVVMYQAPALPGPEPTLRAVLDGPGRVRIIEPPGVVPHPETWAQVRRRIPARVPTTASPVDLVCAIDLSGAMEAVLKRKDLVRALVELLADEYTDERHLRVAIVTCTDHVFGRGKGKEYDPVTSASELGSAADALEWLRTAEGVNIKDPLCAPVEDLLHESLDLLSGSRRQGRRPRLLTLAGRPPHPYPQRSDGTMACPLKFSWERIVAELDAVGARYAIVADTLPAVRGAARADWNRLGPAGQHALSAATARPVAEDLGLLAGLSQRIPLPLTDD